MTQQQLGDAVGVTKVSICCYENGTRTPTLDTLIDLADELKVSLNYLLASDAIGTLEKDKTPIINLAKEEVELIKELRQHIKLYEKLIEDSKKSMEYFESKIK